MSTSEKAMEAARRMRQTFDVSGDKWFKIAADELERLASIEAALSLHDDRDLDRREIEVLRAVVADAGAYIAVCPPPPEATGNLRIELLERRERIGKVASLVAEQNPVPSA